MNGLVARRRRRRLILWMNAAFWQTAGAWAACLKRGDMPGADRMRDLNDDMYELCRYLEGGGAL